MNYHSDEWIANRMQEHYNKVLQYYPENNIIGLFLFGSQNYLVDTIESDIDTKAILISTDPNIWIEEKYECDNGEIIFFLDVRHLIQGIKQQMLSYIEILYTKYAIINPKYASIWNSFILQREIFIREYNPYQLMREYQIWNERHYNALIRHPVSPRIEIVKKYGYDHKQLYYLILLYQQLQCYLAGYPYDAVFNEIFAAELLKAKNKQYSLIEAQALAQFLYKEITKITKTHYPIDKINLTLDNQLNDYLQQFLQCYMEDKINEFS